MSLLTKNPVDSYEEARKQSESVAGAVPIDELPTEQSTWLRAK